MVESYLKDQRQCVQVQDLLLDFLYPLVGVVQGSFLGPLQFLKHINGLPGSHEFPNTTFFADDMNLFHRKNQDELFLLNNFMEIVLK